MSQEGRENMAIQHQEILNELLEDKEKSLNELVKMVEELKNRPQETQGSCVIF